MLLDILRFAIQSTLITNVLTLTRRGIAMGEVEFENASTVCGARGFKTARTSLVGLICAAALLVASVGADADPLVELQPYRGKVVYLDFWASWCAPCRQSFPWMQAMQETYRQQGFLVLAVNEDRDQREAQRFLTAYNPGFEVRFDSNGKMAERFELKGMPTGLLIDRNGKVRFTHIGFLPADRAAYEDQIRQLLSDK
ncbi:MAG TPA: TlpA disulfide reductase family protein [Steroidobacteraceae bacterium]|jgi:thiol-disulfide isomerase/thioredoxin